MIFGLKLLNSDATVNNFKESMSAQAANGANATIMMRIIQPDKAGLRYIPATGATFSIDLMNSDGTTLTKTPTQPFAGDKSVLQLDLSDTETELLISQNLNVEINEGGVKSLAIAQSGLQMVHLNGDC